MSPESVQAMAGSDLILMQEVLTIDPLTIQNNIGEIGLTLAAFNPSAGLAIAISERFTQLNSGYQLLQQKGQLSQAASRFGIQNRFRERGLLSSTLQDTVTNQEISASTAHPIVCVRPYARHKQIEAMSEHLQKQAIGASILGADMNHYPRANKVDIAMARRNRLIPVSNTDPTCLLVDTHHSWLRYLGFPDARLDTMLHRGLAETSSEVVTIDSDHKAIRATFIFL